MDTTRSEPIPVTRKRRYLSGDYLLGVLRHRFSDVADPRRQSSARYSMEDTLMAALAMFSLKDPSLLAFEAHGREPAIRRLFGIGGVPSDSRMREILDGIDIEPLNEAFADVFYELQRGNELRKFATPSGHYLLAVDATGSFGSTSIRCPHCLERKNRSGTVQFEHQAVAAVLVHPETGVVIPLAIEPIVKQDGKTKNDCERNASARLLRRVRKQHPMLKLLVIEDGLSSNAPHIKLLEELKMDYLLGAKPGDHEHLFDQVIEASDEERDHQIHVGLPKGSATIQYCASVALNASHPDLKVNFLQYVEVDSKTGEICKRFSWVTNLDLQPAEYTRSVRYGRLRWRIENETFNTLKNQGYHLEHNYGHGKQNLSTVLMLLTFLAFLLDQIQQHCCPAFQAALACCKSRRMLWENLRSHVRHFVFNSFWQLWNAIATGSAKSHPPPMG